jgi:L-alanine-DL-glutamate epimerase-like enolase superfamily enzyme
MYFLPRTDQDQMVERAKKAVERGFRTIYMKVGIDPEEDVRLVRAVREAVGSGPNLRVDANEAWSPSQAINMIRKMEEYDLEFVEQPVHFRDFDGMATVRRSVDVPIAANQTSWTQFDVLEVIKREAADIVLTDPHQLGGLFIFKKVAAMLEFAGIPIVKHTFCDLGVSANAAMHVVASSPNFTYANQTYGDYLSDDIIQGGLPNFEGDCVSVSQRPGIGVELDPERMEKYSKLYREKGEFSAFTPNMGAVETR